MKIDSNQLAHDLKAQQAARLRILQKLENSGGKITECIVDDLNKLHVLQGSNLFKLNMRFGEYPPGRCRTGQKQKNETCTNSVECPYNTSCFGPYEADAIEKTGYKPCSKTGKCRCFPDRFFNFGNQGTIDMNYIFDIINNPDAYPEELVEDATWFALTSTDGYVEHTETSFPTDDCPNAKYANGETSDWEICFDHNQCGKGSVCLSLLDNAPDKALTDEEALMAPTVCVPCDSLDQQYSIPLSYCETFLNNLN